MSSDTTDARAGQAETPLHALIGTVIAERYHLDAVLGMGAMGVVFRARMLAAASAASGPRPGAPAAGTPIALKLVLPDPRNPRNASRLLRGARLATQLAHPHVIQTLGFGRFGAGRQACYVAMELIEGVTLDRLLHAELDSRALCTLMYQVLDALAHVHARGILHRDVKPDNVFVTRAEDGQLTCKVGDFGIAAEVLAATDDPRLTQPGTVVGTPLYMAPEQATGKDLDTPALDLYPVGVMLYELLGGKPPFSGATMELLTAKLTEAPPPLVPRPTLEVSPSLFEIVMRLLAREPRERYGFAADVMRALEPLCGPASLPAARWHELTTGTGARQHDSALLAAWKEQATLALAASATTWSTDSDRSSGMLAAKLPVVGRDDLVHAMMELASAVEAGQGRAVLLAGDSGVGKTALLEHVITGLAEQGRFQVLRTALHASLGLHQALRHALETALGTVGRSLARVRHAVERLLEEQGDHVEPQELADLIAFLRPIAGVTLSQGRSFALVHRCLKCLSRRRPVLLALDDLHRGGPDAAAFLDFLLFQCGFEPFPLLIVGTVNMEQASEQFRRTLARSARFEGTTRHLLDVRPLDRELLANVLTTHLGVKAGHARHMAEYAAGNPLLALYLAQAGWRGPRGSHEPESQAQVQATTDSLLRAMHSLLLDSMRTRLARAQDPTRCQALLEAVAVLGSPVEVPLLEAFLDNETSPAQLADDLETCFELGLLEHVDLGANEAVALTPGILGDVLLAGLGPRRPRRLHQRAIEVRMERAGQHLDAEAGALGDHYAALGRPEQAVDWWLRGLHSQLNGGRALRGIEWGLKALTVLQPVDPRHGRCSVLVGRVLLDAGDPRQAEAVLRPVVEGSDVNAAMLAGDVLADVYENLGDVQAWSRVIAQLEQHEQTASPAGRRALYLARSMWHIYAGDTEACYRDAMRALEGAASGEQAQRVAQRLVYANLDAGHLDQAAVMAERALHESGSRVDLQARSLRMLGIVSTWQGQARQAAEYQQRVFDLCQRHGLIARIPIALFDLGDALRIGMDLDQARVQYQAAARAAQEQGLRSALGMCRAMLIVCDLLQERTEGILARIRESLPGELSLGQRRTAFYHLLQMWAHILEGELERAHEAYAGVGDPRRMKLDVQHAGLLTAVAGHLVPALASGVPTRASRLPALAEAARVLLEGALVFLDRFPALGDRARCEQLLAELQAARP